MAIVYEGEHVALGKRVAVKLVHSLFVNDPDVVHRFEREARSASAVESEHIVHVFDVGADAELGLFLVMELLKGEDLSTVLARRARLDPMFAAGRVKQASLGLEKAHAAGIVHRDLKPANVFLVERDDGTTLVKLVDFGIAKIVRDAEDARFARKGITRRGTAIGTPQYMSPEQAQALDTVDQRTDVFSLGAVLFEAIAGQPYMPERPTYEQTILQLVSTRAPRLSTVVPDVPPALDDLVADMLEHDLDRRVPSMRAVRERLEGAYPELAGSAVKLRSLPPPSSPSLDRYVAHGSAAPHGVTVSGTSSAAMILPRTRRPPPLRGRVRRRRRGHRRHRRDVGIGQGAAPASRAAGRGHRAGLHSSPSPARERRARRASSHVTPARPVGPHRRGDGRDRPHRLEQRPVPGAAQAPLARPCEGPGRRRGNVVPVLIPVGRMLRLA